MRWISQPRLVHRTCGCNLAADFHVEDLGPAAGKTSQAGRDQVFENPLRPAVRADSANQAISAAVQAFKWNCGKASCSVARISRYQSKLLVGWTAADDVNFRWPRFRPLHGPGRGFRRGSSCRRRRRPHRGYSAQSGQR